MRVNGILLSAGLGLAASAAVLLSFAGAGLAGCGSCSAIGLAGLVVTVTDGPGGPRICDATVTARDGDHSEILAPSPAGPDCTYAGALERPGTYSIEVVSGTRSKTIDGVQVTGGAACGHVNPQHPTVALDP